jgi:hypothetical protein
VLAEIDCFFRDERRAMQVFMQYLARGAFTYAPTTLGQLSRAMDVDRRFADLGLGLVDGSLVALAESSDRWKQRRYEVQSRNPSSISL